MSKGFLIAFAAGIVLVIVLVGSVLYTKQGAHLQPTGSVLKVRTQDLDADHSLLLVDLRIVNESDVTMVVRTISMSIETADGKEMEGVLLAGTDLKQVFQYYPLLGEQFNPPLVVRDTAPPHQKTDRMLGARFDLPLAELERRKNILINVEDTNGPIAAIAEKATKK